MLQRRIHRALHLDRRANANRVGHADVLHSDFFQQARHQFNPLRRHLAFIGATNGTRNRTPHVNILLPGRGHHRSKAFNALSNRAVDVALAEGFTGRCKDHDLIGL